MRILTPPSFVLAAASALMACNPDPLVTRYLDYHGARPIIPKAPPLPERDSATRIAAAQAKRDRKAAKRQPVRLI